MSSDTLVTTQNTTFSWAQFFPFLNWLPMVNQRTLKHDWVAGLTGALVVLPQGVVFASIAGMPPAYGLYASMIPAIVAALYGSSWHLVSGPTTAASLVVFSSLSALIDPATGVAVRPESGYYILLALTLTIMVGLIEVLLAVFKLGGLVNFISHSVVIGFTAGAGILIAASQIKHFFGFTTCDSTASLRADAGDSLSFLGFPLHELANISHMNCIPRSAHFHETILFLFTHIQSIAIPVAAVGSVTLLAGLLSRRYFPRFPYMIVAILAGSVFSVALSLFYTIVPTVGALPRSLPPLSMPSFDPVMWRKLAPVALAVTLFALTEALSISRALAVRSGQHINANQEFMGQGLSNIVGSFFSGYVATGSFNRSGVNYEAGAKTPFASIIASVLLMAIVLLVAPLAAYMPKAAMAGVLFMVGYGLIDKHHIAQIIRTSKAETGVLVVTFLATLFLELEYAIFAGVMLSLMLYLNHTSHPHIRHRVPDPEAANRKFTDARPDLPECMQFRWLRLDGSLFFGAVNAVNEEFIRFQAADPNVKYVALVMQSVNFVDIAGAEMLAQLARGYRAKGGTLFLIRPKRQVVELLERGGYLDEIGRENIFYSKTTALRTIYRKFDYSVCANCGRKVFVECARMGKQEPLEDEPEITRAVVAAS
jgi:sulfate permease, SulP family